MPSCVVARVEPLDQREQIVERGRRRQPLQVDPQAGLAARLDLVADVDLRRRVVADENDAEAGRTAGLRRERVDVGQHRLANRGGDGLAVEDARAHVATDLAHRASQDDSRCDRHDGDQHIRILKPNASAISGLMCSPTG